MVIEDSVRSSMPAHAVLPEGEIERYDFGRPATLSREHARVLELSFETFSRQWSAQLTARTRSRVQISLDSLTLETYDEYADGLPATPLVIVAALPDSDSRVLLEVPVSTALSWIVQMLGGRGTGPAAERALTQIEQALIRALATEAMENVTNSLGGLLPAGATISGLHYSVPFAQATAAGDLVIVARMSMRVGDRTVGASVALPAPIILSGLSVDHDAPASVPPELLRQQVELSPVELALRLAPRTIRPNEVLNLSVGDVISIAHAADRPLELVVGGTQLGTAAVGTSGARLACVVTATAPATPIPAEEPV